MRRMQTIEKVIGENTFYIRPFGAFAAANISGELAALLSPILAGIAPLFGGLDTGDNGSAFRARTPTVTPSFSTRIWLTRCSAANCRICSSCATKLSS